MPRIGRKNIKESYIHVITQGIKKEYIFGKEVYKKQYIKLLKDMFKQYAHLELLSYCIMDNHAHLLIYMEEIAELSKLMSRVNTSYAIYYNKNENRVGYVFRNRYYSQVIMNEKHLYNTIVYIHRNPVRAKIVKEMKDYKYSSYNLIKNGKIDKKSMNLLFNTENYLEKFDWMHKNFTESNILEVEEKRTSNEEIEEFIKNFSMEYKISIDEIGKNNYFLKLIVEQLMEKYCITNKQICEVLKIGKNRITYMKKTLQLK